MGNTPEVELTYGKKAVGLRFNHTQGEAHDAVHDIKVKYAEIIDLLDELRESNRNEQARLASVAITEAQTAQMWAVKAITWEDK